MSSYQTNSGTTRHAVTMKSKKVEINSKSRQEDDVIRFHTKSPESSRQRLADLFPGQRLPWYLSYRKRNWSPGDQKKSGWNKRGLGTGLISQKTEWSYFIIKRARLKGVNDWIFRISQIRLKSWEMNGFKILCWSKAKSASGKITEDSNHWFRAANDSTQTSSVIAEPPTRPERKAATKTTAILQHLHKRKRPSPSITESDESVASTQTCTPNLASISAPSRQKRCRMIKQQQIQIKYIFDNSKHGCPQSRFRFSVGPHLPIFQSAHVYQNRHTQHSITSPQSMKDLKTPWQSARRNAFPKKFRFNNKTDSMTLFYYLYYPLHFLLIFCNKYTSMFIFAEGEMWYRWTVSGNAF